MDIFLSTFPSPHFLPKITICPYTLDSFSAAQFLHDELGNWACYHYWHRESFLLVLIMQASITGKPSYSSLWWCLLSAGSRGSRGWISMFQKFVLLSERSGRSRWQKGNLRFHEWNTPLWRGLVWGLKVLKWCIQLVLALCFFFALCISMFKWNK